VINGLENRFLPRCFATSSNISNDALRKENSEKSSAKGFWKNTIESLIFVANRIFSLLKLFRWFWEMKLLRPKTKDRWIAS